MTVEQIDRIRVYSFREATRLSCAEPRDTEEAQYNLAYGVACAVLIGNLGPVEVTPPAISDPRVLTFMKKIEPVVDPQIQKGFPTHRHARVEITTTDGRTFDSGVVDPLWGGPADRPSDQDLIEKFQAVTGPVLGQTGGQALQEMIWNLEQEPRAARLVDLAAAKGR
jgi:2-methylcitrate dehydratase PrpD